MWSCHFSLNSHTDNITEGTSIMLQGSYGTLRKREIVRILQVGDDEKLYYMELDTILYT